MDYPIRHAFLLFLILCLFPVTILSQPIIIDHTCTDLSQVPQHWINQARNQCVPHYAFTSHGSQIMYGLDGWHQLNAHWHFAAGPGSLPLEAGNPNTLRIFGGNQATTYVEPGGYWQGPGGMNYTRNVLNANPGINVSMWSWCTQLNWYTAPEVDAYLASMTQLESEYPGVIFVYFTGNAQAWSGHHTYTSGAEGWNRYQRNEQIRTYCRDNNKVLFDFADFDCWYQGEQATASWGSNTYPREHDHYNMNQAAHTSNENCTNKGGAFWWMLARISGWDGPPSNNTLTYPQYVNGEMNSIRNRTRVILWNPSPTPDSGWIRFRNGSGQLNDVPIGGNPMNSYGYHIQPWGTEEVETDGIGSPLEMGPMEVVSDGAGPQLQTGPMEVVSDRGTDSQLKGTEIFELLGYSVSVANAPQYDYHRVYVSVTADENTGVGLYNPDLLNPIIMDLVLMDDEGDELAQAEMTMEPGQQLARFVDEAELFQAYFNANPGECQGTLNITVRDGNSACIMGIIQKRATGAMIAVSPSYLRFGSKLTFPQYVNGETNGTLNRTRIILMNNGDVTETGNIRFRNNTGQLAGVPIGGVPQNTVNFSIDPMGTLEIETDGTGTQLMTGPVEVTSNLGATSQLQGTEIFELLGYSVSMPDAPESNSRLVYVSVTSKENTGIAAFNPNLTSAVTMDLALIDDQGVEQAQAVMTLTAGQQLARFADEPELFQAFFNGVTGDWKGTLRITVRNQNTTCVMGIIQKRATGAMIAVSTD